MINITSILKVLLLVITLSIVVSCGEDKDCIVKPDDNPDNQKQDSSEKIIDIVSDPVTVSGKLKILTSDKYNMYDWNLGEQKIISELSVGDSLIQVGEGKIEVSGDFSYTLDGTLSSQYLVAADKFAETMFYDLNEVIKEPDSLYVSMLSIKTYILLEGNKKEILEYDTWYYGVDSLAMSIISPENQINWRFFSDIGMFKIFTGLGDYIDLECDILFDKGWNPIIHDIFFHGGISNVDANKENNLIFIYE